MEKFNKEIGTHLETKIFTEASDMLSENSRSIEDSAESSESFKYSDYLARIGTKIDNLNFGVDMQMLKSYLEQFPDQWLETGKSIFIFMYRMYNLKSMNDLMLTAIDFLHSVFGFRYMMDCGKKIYQFVKELISRLYNSLITSKSTLNTEGRAVDVLRYLRGQMSTVLNSEIVTAIRDFVLSLVSFGLFKKETDKKFTDVLGPAPKKGVFELFDVILGSVISFLTFGENVANGAPMTKIFTYKDPIVQFESEAVTLDLLKDLTYSGLPVEGKICRREYLTRVVNCVISGKALQKITPVASPQRRKLDGSLRKVQLLKSDFTNMMIAQERPMPFVICIEGCPGIGKGLLIDVGAKLWAYIKKRAFDSSHIYHRQSTEEYWSGYEPLSKPIIHYSEPGSLHRDIAKQRGDPSMEEFLSVCDNQPYMCNMADVESKGKVFAMPELIIMDCNDPGMNLDLIVNNPAAVRRRILYIKPTVKKEFQKTDGFRIDAALSLQSSTPKLDRWNFDVYRMEPRGLKTSIRKDELKRADIYSLSNYLKSEFTAHISEQDQRVDLMKGISMDDYTSSAHPEAFGPEPEKGTIANKLWGRSNDEMWEFEAYMNQPLAVQDPGKKPPLPPRPETESLTSQVGEMFGHPKGKIFTEANNFGRGYNYVRQRPNLSRSTDEVNGPSEIVQHSPECYYSINGTCNCFQTPPNDWWVHSYEGENQDIPITWFVFLFRCLGQAFLAFLCLIPSLFGLSLWSCLGVFMYFTPGALYKKVALYIWKNQYTSCREKFELNWEYFKATLGLPNSYVGSSPPSHYTRSVIALLTGLMVVYKFSTVTQTFFSEDRKSVV